MAERFSFDDFDERCRKTIESAEHFDEDAKLCLQGIERDLNPGEIGGALVTPLYTEWFGDEPDDAA